jgi:MFS transporter, SP family, general alpha glucoside:H+ symporter
MSGQPPQRHDNDRDQVAAALPFGESAIQRAAVANPEFVDLSFAAKAATDNERSMTLLQGIKLYPKAVGWSMLLSTCIVMEGYDLVLLGRYSHSHTCLHSYALLRQKPN